MLEFSYRSGFMFFGKYSTGFEIYFRENVLKIYSQQLILVVSLKNYSLGKLFTCDDSVPFVRCEGNTCPVLTGTTRACVPSRLDTSFYLPLPPSVSPLPFCLIFFWFFPRVFRTLISHF